jgi:hypothetical protein
MQVDGTEKTGFFWAWQLSEAELLLLMLLLLLLLLLAGCCCRRRRSSDAAAAADVFVAGKLTRTIPVNTCGNCVKM